MSAPASAHLVVWLDLTAYPKVVDTGVYGEAHPSSTDLKKRYPVEITSSRGSTYQNAVENLRRYISSTPRMHWALVHFAGPKEGT